MKRLTLKLNACLVIKWLAYFHLKDYINYLKATWTLFMKLVHCFSNKVHLELSQEKDP